MYPIISQRKSVVVSADVATIAELRTLTRAIAGIPGIGGIKPGMLLGLQGLAAAVECIRENLGTKFPVIFDYQKAGNDIPAMGAPFARALRTAGVDAAILFPFAGPNTQEAWTKACFDEGLSVITGCVMTHEQFLVSESGYINDDAVQRVFEKACSLGVNEFVVPGTKIEWVEHLRKLLTERFGYENNFVLYAPGFITQGGDISECAEAAGDRWHAIVGSAIYKQPTEEAMRAAAKQCCNQIAVAA